MRLVFLIISSCALCSQIARAEDRSVDFSRDILPILSDHCFQCHGPDENAGREGDLRLDDEDDVKRDRGGYSAVVEGSPEQSELVHRITSTDADIVMPPESLGRPLDEEQIELLTSWIKSGAVWGRHWAFEPLQRPRLPDTGSQHPIDSLIQKQLRQKGWKTNGPALPETRVRRLSLDLRGYPPSPAEVRDFVTSESPKAWEELVDQFLASPAFGERMAWDWMEVARYADSNGYQGDGERTMWPWRDWVVKSFNENLPFDQFTLWQLAGDLLPNATDDQILATGFCRNHMINGEGGRIAEENRVDYVMDMTETMGTAWLGLTLNCCRCHDHKFDPILNSEYYQLTAFFNQTPVNGGGGNPQTPPVLAFASSSQKQTELELVRQLEKQDLLIGERRAAIAGNYDAWELDQRQHAAESPWSVLRLDSLQSERGQTIAISQAGTIKTSGANPDQDTYTLLQNVVEPVTIGSVLLEAIRDSEMTQGGFARSNSGNFVLTEFEVSYQSTPSDAWETLKIADGVASFEQGGLKVSNAFDGNRSTGWAVYEGKPATRDQAAVFVLGEAASLPPGAKLRIVLRHDSRHVQHNLGSFRLSFSKNTDAKLPEDQSPIPKLLAIDAADRTPEQVKQLQQAFEESDAEIRELKKQKTQLAEKLESLRKSFPQVMVMRDMEEPRKTFILERGIYNQRGSEVEANTPGFLPPLPENAQRNRLALARWLISPENPLTARVVVNRFWQSLFGQGLVKTSEDFGIQAEHPPQRELLDWLAVEFRESGWNVKHLFRLIVTSDMYRQSSDIEDRAIYEADPENRYFTRAPRFRMPSWMIRDSALAASGLLNPTVGGKPVYSYQPEGVWEEATFGKKSYRVDSGDSLYRRSLYTFWRRIVGPTMFFDTAKRQVCEVKPLRTNTPLHALTLMNDVTYVEAARALATMAIESIPEASTPSAGSSESKVNAQLIADRLAFVYQRVLSRVPTPEELGIWRKTYEKSYEAFSRSEDSAREFLQIGQYKSPSEVPASELAAWSAVCLNLLNLDESLTRE